MLSAHDNIFLNLFDLDFLKTFYWVTEFFYFQAGLHFFQQMMRHFYLQHASLRVPYYTHHQIFIFRPTEQLCMIADPIKCLVLQQTVCLALYLKIDEKTLSSKLLLKGDKNKDFFCTMYFLIRNNKQPPCSVHPQRSKPFTKLHLLTCLTTEGLK